MPTIKANIVKDDEDFPALATFTDGAKKLEVTFDKDTGFTISGSRRSFTQELFDAIRIVYPAQSKLTFEIPQPLSVVNVSGGNTILIDDFENLLKWEEVMATIAVDNTFAFSKDKSLKLSAAAGGTAIGTRYFAPGLNQRLKFESYFTVDDYTKLTYIRFYIALQSQSGSVVSGGLSFDCQNQQWQYFNDIAGWTSFLASGGYYKVQGVGGPWQKIAFLVDFDSQLYEWLQINHFRQEIKKKCYFESGVASVAHALLTVSVDAEAGQDVNAWIDDPQITEVD